jgi:hypothetical protein
MSTDQLTSAQPESQADAGAAVASAQHVLAVHVGEISTGRCRRCGDPAPCALAQAAQTLLALSSGLPLPRRGSAALTAD